MTVEVDSDAIRSSTSGRSAVARRVRFASAIVGPVASVDAAAGRFTVLGQTVVVAVDNSDRSRDAITSCPPVRTSLYRPENHGMISRI